MEKRQKISKTKSVDSGNPPKKTKSGRSILQWIGMAICLCVFIGCAVYLGKYYLGIKHSQDGVKDLKQLLITTEAVTTSTGETGGTEEVQPVVEYENIDGRLVQKKFAELYRMNPDVIGWITIADTQVDYPVMQNMDENEYYIHRNFEEAYDGSGLPFLDFRCDYQLPTANLLIYGHNMKAGTMFAQIMKYADQEFYDKHKTFTFDTLEADGEYEVVAAFYSQIYAEDDTTHFKYYMFFDAEDEAAFDDYVSNIMKLSTIETGIVPKYGDSLITLSTCAYHTEDGRFAVVARKVEKQD